MPPTKPKIFKVRFKGWGTPSPPNPDNYFLALLHQWCCLYPFKAATSPTSQKLTWTNSDSGTSCFSKRVELTGVGKKNGGRNKNQ